ncbi:HAMP domain-containing sensor histidine kinase [Marinospirillum sp.]|uniref:sensor histidine kinase n=1 Tax=Marinospirillum sp. TaxID=2183934 RepID=UPI00286FF6B0|nr:HAMP domain-containing sensor histidine kinase [Marinospirillum sp.]MDR9467503.1 HAMP domain-containing sensor histidine kinase [Marinospirillum sp.]
MPPLLRQPLPLKTWLQTERHQLNARVERAYQRGQELAVRLEIGTADSQKTAGPHDLLKQFIAAEIRMRQLLLSHPAPLLVTDQKGQLLLTNLAAKQLLAALGYVFDPVKPVYPSLQEAFPELESDREMQLQVSSDYAEAEEVVFLVRETPIQWQETPARLLLFHDVSMEAQARQKLEEAVSSLENLNRMKSEFMSMATHEFRTPLASMFSSLQLMDQYCQKLAQETDSRWLDKLQKHVKRSEEAITHLDGLVQEMLTLEKTRAGRTYFTPHPVRVDQLVSEVVDNLSSLAEQLDIPLAVSNGLQDPQASYPLDAQLVQHILTNLISNALRFSSPGQPVAVEFFDKDQGLCLQVVDQGRGIPAEEVSHLGAPFFRASNVDNVQGTGLGLSIVRRFVDLHQGRLEIQSRLGEGSCFCIWLPLAASKKEKDDDQDRNVGGR